MAGAMLAAGPVNPVTVTLAEPVSVGSVTLPAGQYVMTSYDMGGEEFFVVRGEKVAAGHPACHAHAGRVRQDRNHAVQGRRQVALQQADRRGRRLGV